MINEARLNPQIDKNASDFYMDKTGTINSGRGDDDDINISLDRKYKELRAYRISPLSKKFKDMISELIKIVPDIESYSFGGGIGLAKPISAYMKEPVADINQIPTYLYHGTSTNLWNKFIKKQGLFPRDISQSTGSYGAQNVESLSLKDRVYLGASPNMVMMAAKQAAEKHGGYPMVIKVNTSQLNKGNFVSDEDAKDSIRRIGTIAHLGRIPPTLLEPILIQIGKEIQPFKEVPYFEHPLLKRINDGEISSSYDSPYFYALVDLGVLEQNAKDNSNFKLKRKISPNEFDNMIKTSGWVNLAKAISKDFNDIGGNKGIKSINYLNYDEKKLSDNQIQILKIFFENEIYFLESGQLRLAYSLNIKKLNAVSKQLTQMKLEYRDLVSIFSQIKTQLESKTMKNEVYSDSGLGKWFKEKWVDISRKKDELRKKTQKRKETTH